MDSAAIQQTFEQAVQYHAASRFREAEQLYRQLLSIQPDHAESLHNLGVLAHQFGKNDAALDLIRRAIVLKPQIPEFNCNLGDTLRSIGRLDEALGAYRQAVALRPQYAEAHGNLGVILKEMGRVDEAIAEYRQAIALKPNFPEAYSNLGNALRDKGQLDEAAAAHRQAIALRPTLPEVHYNLGIVLKDQHKPEEAIAAFRQAVALRPNYADALTDLANELRNTGQYDEAIALYNQSIAARPSHAETFTNLGLALEDLGHLDDAIAAYRRSIALKPDLAQARSNLGMALLLRGDWDQAWPEYEWRFKVHDVPSRDRGFKQPRWTGGDLHGRAILLYGEQGFGDTINFIRYLPQVAQLGGRIIVEVPRPLVSLLRQIPGVEQWIAKHQPLPPFDVQCPLMSLPGVFATTPRTIPPLKDLLRPDPELEKSWQRRLEDQPAGVRVGLAWAGSTRHKNDRNRSISLAAFAPLATIPGIEFFSLQKGHAGAQSAQPPAPMRLTDWTGDLHEFADTAALISNLDLIITVDTAVAHLAASMGKPVWLLLPFIPDWRWLREGDQTPWYPTMRLFRQTQMGRWPDVIQRVADALAIFAVERASG